MPIRSVKFVNNGIYHIYNRTIDKKRIFTDNRLCQNFLETISYYRSSKTPVRFSEYKRLSQKIQNRINRLVSARKYFRIEILAYSFMPTHFHFLVQQILDNGVKKFFSDVANSLTKFYNVKNQRIGPILLPRFHAKDVITDEQLKHSSRYVHLQAYSGNLVKKVEDLKSYPWSSYNEYFNEEKGISEKKIILGLFGDDIDRYKKFVHDHADWQKNLENTKYLEKWKL